MKTMRNSKERESESGSVGVLTAGRSIGGNWVNRKAGGKGGAGFFP